jgi:methionyl aminopeptidase
MKKQDFLKAGKISAKVREASKAWVFAGAKYSDIADKVEAMILKLGARPAFPVNISANEYAAHDTAKPNDERTLRVGDVIKIDLGASVNGWLGDTAYTVEVGSDKHASLIKASEDALNAAIKVTKVGAELRVIGKAIQEVIKGAGFNPIRNLGGHPLGENKLHGAFSIPNHDNSSTQKLEPGGIAIEPFATTGDGWVENDPEILIYGLKKARPVRNVIARKILKHVISNYGTLPFAERWIAKEFKHYEYGLRALLNEGILHGYHKLREKNKGIVSQSEHSLLINGGTIITTKT